MNRATLLTKTHKELKKHYAYLPVNTDCTVVSQLLFACCLENTPHETAQQALTEVRQGFYDLNEMRVSSVREMSEFLHRLPDPTAAATRLKRVLQHIFEAGYSFEMEELKKQKLGVSEKHLDQIGGTTPFVVSYVIQTALAGHSIPVDDATLNVLYVLGVITESEREANKTPGLTRAIPKNKGQEFGYLLHEIASAYALTPFSSTVRSILTAINSEAKERFPKRVPKKTETPPEPEPVPAKPKEKASVSSTSKLATKKKTPEKKKSAPSKKEEKPAPAESNKGTAGNEPVVKKAAGKKAVVKKATAKSAGVKKTETKKAETKKKAIPAKKSASKVASGKKAAPKKSSSKSRASKSTAAPKKSRSGAGTTKGKALSKKKPR